MSMKLYVGNLPFSISESELHDLFSQVGAVESARIVTDRETGRSRGFGFVEFANKEEGEAAIARFNGHQMNGRPLTVNGAKPQEPRGGGRGGFGGNRGGGRGGYGGGGNRGGYGDRW